MKNLVKSWPSYKKIFKDKPLALFLDFDGTLSPIAATPDQAIFSPQNKALLEKLSKTKKCKVAVVSGRSLEDLKKKINLPGKPRAEPQRAGLRRPKTVDGLHALGFEHY